MRIIEFAKKNKTLSILVATLAILFVIFVLSLKSCVNSHHPTIAFYGLSDEQIEKFKEAIHSIHGENGKPIFNVQFATLDSSVSLAAEIKSAKKIDLLITVDGISANRVASKIGTKNAIDSTAIDEMTSSLRVAAGKTSKNTISKLPILIDHLEIAIDRTVLEDAGIWTISSWKNIETFVVKSKELVANPIIFTGGDGKFFLTLVGALCESFEGKKSYEKAVKIVSDAFRSAEKSKSEPNYTKVAQELAEKDSAPFHSALVFLNKLYHDGLLANGIFSMTEQDVLACMQVNQAACVIQSLSEHRRIPLNAIERYSAIYFPSTLPSSERSFTAPIICAIPITKNKTAHKLAVALVTRQTQESLCRSTGLAPVLADCPTPDKESGDVRYWVSATNVPLNGFAQDALENFSYATPLANMLINYVIK